MSQSRHHEVVPFPSGEFVRVAKDRLQRSPYATLQRLVCHCDGDRLVLRGRLPSFYHKQLAQEAVGNIDGVVQVVNETEVVSALTVR